MYVLCVWHVCMCICIICVYVGMYRMCERMYVLYVCMFYYLYMCTCKSYYIGRSFFGKKRRSHITFDHSHAHNTYTCEAKDNFKDTSPIETINDKIPGDVLGKWMIECNMMF